MTDDSVAIAGAGPAGLVAARHLAEGGLEVDVYETASTVGGRVRSRSVDGFTLDRGFQVLLTGYPALQREVDLDALDLRTIPQGALLCRDNRRSLLADPLRDPGTLGRVLVNDEVTVGDLYRLWRLTRELREQSRNSIFSGSDRSTLEALLDRGFSDGFLEGFARPFFGGVTLDPTLGTSERVFEYVLKVLSADQTAIPAHGLGAVTSQLAERAADAGATVHLDATVTAVTPDASFATLDVARDGDAADRRAGDSADRDDDGASGDQRDAGSGDAERARADAVVVATDAPTARELTGVESIPTEARSCVTQYHSLPEVAAPDAARLHLNADPDDREAGWPNHLVVLSNAAPELAPDDRALISTTFLGDAVDAPVAKLDDRVRRALAAWHPERHFADLELLATDRIEFGQFAQPPGVHETLPDVDAPDGRCYLAGEYTQWSSLNAALESGRTAAQQVLGDL